MSPIVGMMRGTSRDRYMSEPSSIPLMRRHEGLPEQHRRLVGRDVRRAGGDERGSVCGDDPPQSVAV